MTWWTYVERATGGATYAEIGALVGLTGPSISRWKTGANGVSAETAMTLDVYAGQFAGGQDDVAARVDAMVRRTRSVPSSPD